MWNFHRKTRWKNHGKFPFRNDQSRSAPNSLWEGVRKWPQETTPRVESVFGAVGQGKHTWFHVFTVKLPYKLNASGSYATLPREKHDIIPIDHEFPRKTRQLTYCKLDVPWQSWIPMKTNGQRECLQSSWCERLALDPICSVFLSCFSIGDLLSLAIHDLLDLLAMTKRNGCPGT